MSDDQTDNTGNEQETETEVPPGGSEEEHQSSPGFSGSSTDKPSTSETSTRPPQEVKSFTNVCTDFVVAVYKDRYYRQILKSVLVFLVALKMAHESRMMVIPLKEYEPFGK